jgi:DNA-binding CsgD family transcriptional regulator
MAELADSAEAGAPLAIALVPYARGWTSSGGGDRVAAFRRAADAFTGTDCHWWSARSLMLAGEAAPGSEGVEDLLEARRRFREIDAPGWRSGCEAALRARGHRFVMASRHTDESDLSTREREVLAHVARGLTNREVAERLHISAKTAARHLERIYAKLSVSSRTAAVTAAVERGLIADIDVRTSTSSTTSPR